MAKQDFKKDEKVTIRCSTQETTCKVEAIRKRINSSTLETIEQQANTLKALEVGCVTIKTKKPIVIRAFNEIPELGRFVLEKDGDSCAGGIIID